MIGALERRASTNGVCCYGNLPFIIRRRHGECEKGWVNKHSIRSFALIKQKVSNVAVADQCSFLVKTFSYAANANSLSCTHSHIIMTIRRDFVLLQVRYIFITSLSWGSLCLALHNINLRLTISRKIFICRFAACSGIDIFFRFSLLYTSRMCIS